MPRKIYLFSFTLFFKYCGMNVVSNSTVGTLLCFTIIIIIGKCSLYMTAPFGYSAESYIQWSMVFFHQSNFQRQTGF